MWQVCVCYPHFSLLFSFLGGGGRAEGDKNPNAEYRAGPGAWPHSLEITTRAKSRVQCLIDWTTQAPPTFCILWMNGLQETKRSKRKWELSIFQVFLLLLFLNLCLLPLPGDALEMPLSICFASHHHLYLEKNNFLLIWHDSIERFAWK